jgi:hypothetical protein
MTTTLAELHKEWYRYRQIGAAPVDYHLRQQLSVRKGPCIATQYQMLIGLDRAGEIFSREVWVPRNPQSERLH